MRVASKLLLSIIAAIAGLAAVIVALSLLNVIAAASFRTVLPPPTCCIDKSIVNKLATWAYGNPLRRPLGQAGAEMAAASNSSDAISRWVKRCTSLGLSNPGVFDRVKAAFGANGEHYATDPSNTLTQEHVLPVASDLSFLSDSIARARVDNAQDAANDYRDLQVSTWSAILIGLATTVLVSLSSTEFGKGDGRLSRGIRVLAIVFPALGTAVAAITAFYAPREGLSRSSQALVSFRQIHDQIATDIGQVTCPTVEEATHGGGEIALKLVEWKKSIRDARARADAAGLAAVDPTRNTVQDSSKEPKPTQTK
ncbi:MAG: hypothetical protein QOD09_1152 [Bradyrhizobium sp.]|jgi:hypothetical protein|nr:hypothetical protein [Bradyrhizobium sp.]